MDVKHRNWLWLTLIGAVALLGALMLMQRPMDVAEAAIGPESAESIQAVSAPAEDPSSVTLVGNLQEEISSCGVWTVDCAETHLTEIGYGVWREVFTVPVGSWEYKMALNDSWDESYAGNHIINNNTSLTVTTEGPIRFYYDDKTHAVLDSVMDEIAVAAGTFQDELGCPGEWQPECVNTLLTDVDGDGIYTFRSADIPAGNYNFKIAFDEAWGGDIPANDIAFTVPNDGDIVTISWDSDTNDVSVDVASGWEPTGPISVTLAGNLQTAIGCAGDWDVTCPETHLTEMGNGVWRGEFVITATEAMTYEYKMALDDSWDVSYAGNHTANGNTTLYLITGTHTVRFYYDHKTHAVLDSVMDEIVVVVGEVQSALGCSGNWQPECVNTLMTDPDGDGVYQFGTTGIPAGSYLYKYAFDEGWTDPIPPGADNLTLELDEEQVNVLFAWDSATDNVTTTLQTAADLAQPAPQDPNQDEVFYFVMPDRFNDGDRDNNEGGITGNEFDHGFDPTNKGFYHGGDLAGLLDKMDYLEDLGVTAVWMTPMFKNRAVQGEGDDASAGYHGYWIEDFTQVDPHFGTNLELRQVITEAHNRGIKIFFDIITNHTADVIDYAEGQYSYRNKTDYPYEDADGNPFDDRDYIGRPADEWPVLSATVSFPYTPIFRTPDDAAVKVPAWLNDPIYYHNRGNVSDWDDPEEGTYGDFFGLDDLFTEHPVVVEGMIDIYKEWVEFGVDGFRVDTVKHVNIEFWQEFVPAMLEHAESVGNDDFFIFGEVYSGNKVILSRYTSEGEFPAVLDFSFQGMAVQYAAQDAKSSDLEHYFADDDHFITPNSNAYMLPTFLGNHDMGRFGYFLTQSKPSADDAELVARSKLAHALMYFARGMPVVYYGDEQGFTGDGGDKDARENMFPSQVASYNDNNLIGTTATTADDNFDMTHPLYEALGEFGALYQEHRALRRGFQIHRYGADEAGIYAFSRIDRDDKVEYVVAFNNTDAAQTASFPTFQDPGIHTGFPTLGLTAIYTAHDATVPDKIYGDTETYITVTVPAFNFVIYEADLALPASEAAPTITLNLRRGEPLAAEDDLVEISASVGDGNPFAEVTFAARVGAEQEYTILGTDTNAPYRIFFDVSDLPVGAPVSFKAIVHDLNGNYNFDQVDTEVGAYTPPPAPQDYAIIHYHRPEGDYDGWGLHLWGDAVDEPGVTWSDPKPFAGIDDFGAYVAIRLQDATQPVNYIIHKGNEKDTPSDRSFDPLAMPELWLVQGDADNYGSRAEAQGYVTVHYTRTDGDFTDWGLHLWQDGYGMTDWPDRHMPDSYDDFGAVFIISDTLYPDLDFTEPLNFLFHNGAGNQSGDLSFLPTEHAAVWVQDEDDMAYPHRGAIEDYALIHYRRLAGDYGDYTSDDFNDYWGAHAWGAAQDPGWDTPYKAEDQSNYGVWFKIPLAGALRQPQARTMGYILHRGNEKDPGPDQSLDLEDTGYEIWVGQGLASPTGVQEQYTHPAIPLAKMAEVKVGDLSKTQAYWLSEDTIAWSIATDPDGVYYLNYARDAGLTIEDTGIMMGEQITLTLDPDGLPQDIRDKFPHLAGLPALKIPAEALDRVPDILKGQFAVSAFDSAGELRDATGLQIPGVLDDLYTYTGDLGVVYSGAAPSLHLWAPTAQTVTLHLFDDALATTTSITYPMAYDADNGVWSVTGEASWDKKFYLYEVVVYAPSTQAIEHNLVTDPYALSLSMNSARSQIVNLADTTLQPSGWLTYTKPDLANPEDITIYELHVRDFSVADETVPEAERGTFAAFTHADSNGMQHLQALADDGLTHLHLLPVFDIATINEDKSEWQTPDPAVLATYPPTSTEQQAAIVAVADQDGFNWGYDPFHYTVPEGSYSTDPHGPTRIVEFREMVKALNETGLRVVVDVVYNHTNSHGQAEKSVLDKVVPGYYHRLNADGQVENSTCCSNTATEHAMMEKLMIDSLVTWARYYKVDGFRFDLMGHHMKSNMLNVRAALDALTVAEDGIDGAEIYVYGEGWDFGEVANNARGVNATQANMAGTGIGTFNDRARDALRGGGPFDSGEALRSNQGFINGLFYDPNAWNSGSAAELARLHNAADLIRVGLAGNLADYEFIGAGGTLVTGKDVDYNGSPAGYTALPVENIIYVSKHDNQTLYDNNQYKLPDAATMDERVRAQNMGLSFVSLSQGIPFLHAGSDMLRSKSLDRDSYNSGDWFNKLDFTYQDNNWGVGLPPAEKNQENWDMMAPLLANPDLKPGHTDILSNVHHLREMLAIRHSSPLFRLQTAAEVQERVTFHNTGPNQIPGVIVMSLDDTDGTLDSPYSQVIVIFNANDEAQSVTLDQLNETLMIGGAYELHPVQAASHDPVVQTAAFADATFTVPARTTAVFVQEVGPVQPTIYLPLITQSYPSN